MAMRRALLLGLRRRRCCYALYPMEQAVASRSISSALFSGDSVYSIGVHRLNDVQVGNLLSRGYAKKSKAKKARVQEEEEEDEDEDEEEVIEVDPEEPIIAAKEHMESAIQALTTELSKIRTGRASAGMLDHVEVEIEDKHVPLKNVAAVSVSNPQTLSVMPFDTSTIKRVEAAIRASPLNLNPVAAEEVVTVPIPRLTKELCESMCKLVAKAGEEAKKSIRRGRQTAMDQLKKMAPSLSKDDLKRHEKEVDELTKQFIKSADDTCKKKEAEISKGV